MEPKKKRSPNKAGRRKLPVKRGWKIKSGPDWFHILPVGRKWAAFFMCNNPEFWGIYDTMRDCLAHIEDTADHATR